MVSGGGFEGDFVAEGLQFADVVTGASVAVDAGVVVAGAKVDESLLLVADPKMKVTTARVSGGRACARGRERYAWAIVGSGGGFEGDLVAQCLEFADVVAGPAVEIDA